MRILGYQGQNVTKAVIVGAFFIVVAAFTGFAGQTVPVSGEENVVNATGERPEWMQPSSYRYESKGKSDPFMPFIRKEEALILHTEEAPPERPRTPLERIDVTQLRAIGIVWYPKKDRESLAMVQLPDGKGFVLKKGMRVGRQNGVVEDITPEAIIIKERGLDIFGVEKTRDVLIRLHPKKGDQNE